MAIFHKRLNILISADIMLLHATSFLCFDRMHYSSLSNTGKCMDVQFFLFSSGKTIYGRLTKEVRCTHLTCFKTVNPLEEGPPTVFMSLSACSREACICEGYLVLDFLFLILLLIMYFLFVCLYFLEVVDSTPY